MQKQILIQCYQEDGRRKKTGGMDGTWWIILCRVSLLAPSLQDNLPSPSHSYSSRTFKLLATAAVHQIIEIFCQISKTTLMSQFDLVARFQNNSHPNLIWLTKTLIIASRFQNMYCYLLLNNLYNEFDRNPRQQKFKFKFQAVQLWIFGKRFSQLHVGARNSFGGVNKLYIHSQFFPSVLHLFIIIYF